MCPEQPAEPPAEPAQSCCERILAVFKAPKFYLVLLFLGVVVRTDTMW